jgi:hypothetical protein
VSINFNFARLFKLQGYIERSANKHLLRVINQVEVDVLVVIVATTSKFEKYGVSP